MLLRYPGSAAGTMRTTLEVLHESSRSRDPIFLPISLKGSTSSQLLVAIPDQRFTSIMLIGISFFIPHQAARSPSTKQTPRVLVT